MKMFPIVKWAGGKKRILGELMSRIPTSFKRYYEPFFGGGALFLGIQPERAILGDANIELMNMYVCVAYNLEKVISSLRAHENKHCEDHFYKTRKVFNENGLSSIDRAAAFIYLNKTCFNGLHRVNKKGRFNVPFGKRSFNFDLENIEKVSHALRGAKLVFGGYETCVENAKACDFVYFDPPYHGTFTAYTCSRFGEKDQRNLARLAKRLDSKGVHVMISNSDTEFIRSLYQDFEVSVICAFRSMDRHEVGELVITNKTP